MTNTKTIIEFKGKKVSYRADGRLTFLGKWERDEESEFVKYIINKFPSKWHYNMYVTNAILFALWKVRW